MVVILYPLGLLGGDRPRSYCTRSRGASFEALIKKKQCKNIKDKKKKILKTKKKNHQKWKQKKESNVAEPAHLKKKNQKNKKTKNLKIQCTVEKNTVQTYEQKKEKKKHKKSKEKRGKKSNKNKQKNKQQPSAKGGPYSRHRVGFRRKEWNARIQNLILFFHVKVEPVFF